MDEDMAMNSQVKKDVGRPSNSIKDMNCWISYICD